MAKYIAPLALLFLWACAEPVDDIDRTQGNLLRKADLAGEWYMLQTVVGVPPTSGFTFEGETSSLERVRWEIQQNWLVAYRAYPRLRGGEAPSSGAPFDGTENPLAAYPIEAHVDVIRDYNAQTGEQSNVLVENSSDRLWHQREFVRVDWSRSEVVNFEFIAPTAATASVAWFRQEEEGGPDAFYRETDADDVTQYFDVLGKLFVEPDIYGCIYTWWGWAAEDCTSAEIEIRSSFARVPERAQVYEPFHYSDQLLARFGYFRTEFFSYDEQRGVTESGRRYLVNRHHIFEQSQTVDAEGEVTPIPLPERTLRTVPYYLSPDFPDDPLLLEAAQATMAQWNDGIRDGLESVMTVDRAVFVLCGNPVGPDEHAACGDEGFAPRMGDLRYSTLHWVDTETLEGLLGYGPSAADPITGEIVSGKAYVYGAAVSTWAAYAVDVLRYFNDELELEILVQGAHFSDEVEARIQGRDRLAVPDERLKRVPLDRAMHRHGRPVRPAPRRQDLRPFDRDRVQRRLEAARDDGRLPLMGHDEVKRALAGLHGAEWDALPDAVRERLDPAKVLSPITFERQRARRRHAMARSADFHDMLAPDLAGIVRRYAQRTDYDQVWRELRAEIFAAVAEHEVGHTVGLRHNFQGSYDSLNYGDDYWALRSENLTSANSLGDLFEQSRLTEAQIDGEMRQKQYSTIMDYGYSWQSDLDGLGLYDRAALVFGYTAGSYSARGARCDAYPSTATGDGCLAKLPGLVQVFEKSQADLDRAGELLDGRELGFTYDDSGVPAVTLLERYHYTTLAQAFPSLDDFGESARRWLNYADYLDAKGDADRPVRVPFLNCPDEWAEGVLSCHLFDQGADPYELTMSKINDYRAYYPFVNFRRDRPWFDVWDPLFIYYGRVFLPLSDYFQSWYIAPWGYDPLFDRSYDLAINSGFNLLAEVLATPPYGTWCEGREGRLLHISDEPELQGEQAPDPDCVDGGTRVNVPPGSGRRAFSQYDPTDGLLYPYKPQEAGHYWATLAAVWALTDPDAYVLGADGDAGTYAIGFYDWFDREFAELNNSLLTNRFRAFAPRARLGERVDGVEGVALGYPRLAPVYDADGVAFDPETGEAIADALSSDAPMLEAEPTFSLATDLLLWGFLYTTSSYSTRFNDQLNVFRPGTPGQVEADGITSERVDFVDPLSGVTYAAVQPRCTVGGSLGRCAECEEDSACRGFTGFLGGWFCQPVDDGDTFYCLKDCTNDPGACAANETCDARGNCVPADGTCRESACTPAVPEGTCPDGEICRRGVCEPRAPATPHCEYAFGGDSGAVQMVLRGRALAGAYQDALEAWQTGSDDLFLDYLRARYDLTNHVDLVETLLATYDLFGRIY